MLSKSSLGKHVWLLAILFFALFIRLWGINHGFPFIFHPDEPAVIRSAMGIRFDPNPGHFDWPHLQFYLNYGVFFLFIKFRGLLQFLGLQTKISPLFPILWRDPLVFYAISRVFSAVLGAVTAIPVFLTVSNLFNRRAAIIAAAVFALLPFHVHTSHYALVDVPMVFWVAWALYFTSRVYVTGRFWDYALAGLFVGLAAATKYNGGLFAVMVPLAYVLRVVEKRESITNPSGLSFLISSAAFAGLGFALGTPYAFLDYKTFLRADSPLGALWQFKNVGSVDFVTRLAQLVRNLLVKLPDDFGYAPIIAYFAALILLVKNKSPKLWLLFLPSLFVLVYVSGFAKTRSHYYMGIYPFVAAVGGYFADYVYSKLQNVPIWQFLRVVLLTLLLTIPLALSVKDSLILSRKDTRVLLYEWLSKNITVLDYVIYDSDDVAPVLEKFSGNTQHKGLSRFPPEGSQGYIILSDSTKTYDFTNRKIVLELLPNFRPGPRIFVYELTDRPKVPNERK